MTKPNPQSSKSAKPEMTVFAKILQQLQGPAAFDPAAGDRPAEALFAELAVPAFLEVQAGAMRAAGFRAASELVKAGTWARLSWVPAREQGPGAPEARLDIKVVEGTDRPFRAQFTYQNHCGETQVAGVCSHYIDQALLNRWFAHFTELCLTAQAVAAAASADSSTTGA